MKLLLPPVVLALLTAPARDEVALRFEPEEGTVLKRVFRAEASYHLADVTQSVDGEAFDAEEVPDYGMSFEEHIEVTDTVRSVEGGRPTALLRTFDELSQENSERFEDEEASSTYESPLAGRTVEFTWDDEAEAYEVAAADDDELDEEVAAWLAEDLDLRLLLPEGEVEPGDEWDVDPRLYLAFMWPSGLLDFHPEGEEVDEEDRAPSQQTIEQLEGTGSARLEEVREQDGTRVAVIHLELDVTTGSQSVLPEIDDERPEVRIDVELERTLAGTVLWDLDHGHALSAELECEASRLVTQSWTGIFQDEEGEEVSVDVEQGRLLEGTIRYTASIERQ